MALALMFVFSVCVASRGETVVKIGIVAGRMSDAETAAFCDMLQTFFASQETGNVKYELFIADAAGNVDRQKEYVNTLLGQKLKLLVVNYLDSSAVTGTSEKIKSTGTPVLLFGRQMIVREGTNYSAHSAVDELLDQVKGCYISGDLHQASLLQGDILAARPYHGDTNRDGVIHYVIIRDSAPRSESRLRTDMSLRAVGNAGLDAVCLADRNGATNEEQAKAIFERLIREYGTQIEAVICTHDYIAAGVAQAIQEANGTLDGTQAAETTDSAADETGEGAEKEAAEETKTVQKTSAKVNADICVIGMDGTEEAMQLIREGRIAGTVLIDDAAQDRKAQETILKILNGEEIEKYYWAEYTIINSAYVMNLDRQN